MNDVQNQGNIQGDTVSGVELPETVLSVGELIAEANRLRDEAGDNLASVLTRLVNAGHSLREWAESLMSGNQASGSNRWTSEKVFNLLMERVNSLGLVAPTTLGKGEGFSWGANRLLAFGAFLQEQANYWKDNPSLSESDLNYLVSSADLGLDLRLPSHDGQGRSPTYWGRPVVKRDGDGNVLFKTANVKVAVENDDGKMEDRSVPVHTPIIDNAATVAKFEADFAANFYTEADHAVLAKEAMEAASKVVVEKKPRNKMTAAEKIAAAAALRINQGRRGVPDRSTSATA